MKTRIFLNVALLFLSLTLTSQNLKGLSNVSPFHEGLAAVKKDNSWGFIDSTGTLVVDFHKDFVAKEKKYPYYQNGRCLISSEVNGITYFGYRDLKGNIVISPKFANATSYSDGMAIVLMISKELLGKNNLLAKNVVSYSYDEVLIDEDANALMYLEGPIHLPLSKENLRKPPKINSYLLSDKLVVIRDKNNKWEIKSIP